MAHAGNVLLMEAAAIIMLNILIPAFKRNKHLPAKRTCDGPCPLSATLSGFFSMNGGFNRHPAFKPVSKRTPIEKTMNLRTFTQMKLIVPHLREEISPQYSGISC
jgi:hypothetical protein